MTLFSLLIFELACFPSELTQKLPSAIIIGSKKCGTRALLKFIGAHPNVSAAGAEIHYFDRFYHMGDEWYRQQMPVSNQHQITIEKTPKYLIDKQAPERVYQMNPKTKLIVVLRNPVVRAVSEYVQSQWKKKRSVIRPTSDQAQTDSQRFEQMLYEKRLNSSSRTIRANWAIVRNGLYYQHIKNWLEYFPLDQFLFINGEQLIREPSIEIDKLQSFLNLKPAIKREHFVHNRRKGFACIIKPIDSKQVKCLSDQKGRKHPVIDTSILNDLKDFYRPTNQKLFNLINEKPWWPI
jgi:hypothetical protein